MAAPGPSGPPGAITNAMSVDVEDYFQVSVFDDVVPRHHWDRLESRVCANTERLLQIFEEQDVHATFFVLGWVAERFPALIQQIVRLGHEVACHGYAHRLIYDQTPEAFREDIRRAKAVIEAAANAPVDGFRAPSYSITTRSLWALDVLIDEGFRYDASIFPIHHDRYGIPDAPRHPYLVERQRGTLVEVPGSTIRCGPVNVPFGGGGYFRITPYAWTRWAINVVNRRERRPANFYLHPWEVDPDQPRLPAKGLSRFRQYCNLDKTESRLRRLIRDFAFAPISTVFAELIRRVDVREAVA